MFEKEFNFALLPIETLPSLGGFLIRDIGSRRPLFLQGFPFCISNAKSFYIFFLFIKYNACIYLSK
jgi:hypothetical protein